MVILRIKARRPMSDIGLNKGSIKQPFYESLFSVYYVPTVTKAGKIPALWSYNLVREAR